MSKLWITGTPGHGFHDPYSAIAIVADTRDEALALARAEIARIRSAYVDDAWQRGYLAGLLETLEDEITEVDGDVFVAGLAGQLVAAR